MGVDLLGLEGIEPEDISDAMGRFEISAYPTVDGMPTAFLLPDCPCGGEVQRHGTRTITVADMPIRRRPTALLINLQRFKCIDCGKVFAPPVEAIDGKRHMTVRHREQIEEDSVKFTFREASDLNFVDERTVRRIFNDYADKKLGNYVFDLPRVLGMDEKHIEGKMRFVIGDVERRRMLDMLPGRSQNELETYFSQWSIHERAEVEVITQDMYWAYKGLNLRYFPKATIVVDKFHIVQYANRAVEKVRRAVQNSLPNEERIGLKRKWKLLQMREKDVKGEAKIDLKLLFKQHPLVEEAVLMKDLFFDIYESDNRAEADAEFKTWLTMLSPQMRGPFKDVISYLRNKRWRQFVLNYFDHRYTNAYIESLNGLIERLNRVGRGYDFKTLRAKALLRYGISEIAFDLMSVPVHERDALLSTAFGKGVDLSTWEQDLEGGRF